jgi:PAS domain S-box-containing protein
MVEQSLKILVVYDDLETRNQIEETLRTSDIDEFRLESVSSQVIIQGDSVRNCHDVCIVESVGQRASQLIKSLKALLDCPIVAVTWDSGTEVLNALHCGASDCLIRNHLTPAKLEESICAVLDTARNLDELGKYERYYLGLVENSSDLIFTQELNGIFSSINRVIETLTGHRQDEVIGMHIRQLVAPEYVDVVWSSHLGILEDRRPIKHDLSLLSKSRQRIPVQMSRHLVYRHGAPVGLQGVMRARFQVVSLRAAM